VTVKSRSLSSAYLLTIRQVIREDLGKATVGSLREDGADA
jgi:hypothetical protein